MPIKTKFQVRECFDQDDEEFIIDDEEYNSDEDYEDLAEFEYTDDESKKEAFKNAEEYIKKLDGHGHYSYFIILDITEEKIFDSIFDSREK